MKKILFFAVSFLLLCAPIAEAQMKVKWDGNSNINWKVKRCYVKNDKCILDLLLSNEGSTDIQSFLKSRYGNDQIWSIAYDDEGNNYEYCYPVGTFPQKRILNGETTINGRNDSSGNLKFELPAGLTVKAHIVLNDFDEYATKISLIKLTFGLGMAYNGWAVLEIRDIPVTRE